MGYYEYKEYVKKSMQRVQKRERYYKEKKIRAKQNEARKAQEKAHKQAIKNPSVKIPDEITLNADTVREFGSRVTNNSIIADYYDEMFNRKRQKKFLNKSDNVRRCAQSWFFDNYRMQRVRDLKSVFLCHDKFCLNCQKLLQASRLRKYSPLIEKLIDDGKHLYHFTFTLKNVAAEKLKETVKKMLENFKYLTRFFSGNAKSALNLVRYGYIGATRSLEITYEGNLYHPHLHCIFAFDEKLYTEKDKYNVFSWDFRDGKKIFVRAFSDFEIIMQKIWYLLLNGQKVTPENVEKLPLGYSCICDEITSNYYEAFKYTIKLQEKDGILDMTYDNFETLYNALDGVHVFQGYGKLYRVGADEIDESFIEKYNMLVAQLQLVEMPELDCMKIQELLLDLTINPEIRYISRKNIIQYLQEHPEYLAD